MERRQRRPSHPSRPPPAAAPPIVASRQSRGKGCLFVITSLSTVSDFLCCVGRTSLLVRTHGTKIEHAYPLLYLAQGLACLETGFARNPEVFHHPPTLLVRVYQEVYFLRLRQWPFLVTWPCSCLRVPCECKRWPFLETWPGGVVSFRSLAFLCEADRKAMIADTTKELQRVCL